MKKLISLIAVALFINLTVAKAQSTTTTEPAAPVKKEVAAKDAKQCHAASAAQHSCGTEKASTSTTTTLSENHVNAGIAPATEAKDNKASCADAKGMKSCCKSSSKASAFTKDLKQANTSNAIAPKEADAPKQ